MIKRWLTSWLGIDSMEARVIRLECTKYEIESEVEAMLDREWVVPYLVDKINKNQLKEFRRH